MAVQIKDRYAVVFNKVRLIKKRYTRKRPESFLRII